MKNQDQKIIQLKKSLKDFIHQINLLLVQNQKDASKIDENAFNQILQTVSIIEDSLQSLEIQKEDEELQMNTKLIQGFLHQEFFIDKSNIKKTSLIALKNLQMDSLNSFQQMLTFWNSEKQITQVLFDDLYNIIDELAI